MNFPVLSTKEEMAEVKALVKKQTGKNIADLGRAELKKVLAIIANNDHVLSDAVMDVSREHQAAMSKQTTKESTMNFPKLQMLVEVKKKKAKVEDDFEMDFDMEGGEGSVGDNDDAPKGMTAKEAAVIGKKEVLAALKDMKPADRKAVHKRLMQMVEADEAEIAE